MAGQKRVLLLCGDYVEDYEVNKLFFRKNYFKFIVFDCAKWIEIT